MSDIRNDTYSGSRLAAWDDRILRTFSNGVCARERFMGKLLSLTTPLAWGAFCYPLYVAVFFLWAESRNVIAQVAVADLAGLVVLVGLRYATRRARPQGARDRTYVVPWNRYSFPSGHAVRAFAVSVTLTYSGPVWCVLTVLVAAAIALSRLTLARHYPSDVLAGAGIGTLAAIVSVMIMGA